MVNLLDEYVEEMENRLKTFRSGNIFTGIPHEKFLTEFSKHLSIQYKPSYPREVKIPKSVDELLRGDFEPSRVIRIDGPVMYKDKEIWTGNTMKGIDLHFGYENNNKKYLSEFMLDAKNLPHMFIIGGTGSGKSVTINSLLFNMMMEYPPWELGLFMSDPKIVEFKRYGTVHHCPHIFSIAATEDLGYLISILEDYERRMMIRNQILSKAGVTNLKDFREKTGLTMQRNLLVLDECTAMTQKDPKKTPAIAKIIGSILRLGRNTGFHVMMASQQVDSELKKMIETNVPVRAALKCNNRSDSEGVIGNPQAAIGSIKPGTIFVNTNAANKNVDDNHKFIVPNQSVKEFNEEGKFLEELGKKFDFYRTTNFYDEEDKLFKERLIETIKTKEYNEIVLGEPSFVSETPNKFSLKFERKYIENTLIFCNTTETLKRYFQTIYYNCLNDKNNRNIQHNFYISNFDVIDGCDLKRDGFNHCKLDSCELPRWRIQYNQYVFRLLVIEADERVFENLTYTEEDVVIFNSLGLDLPANEVNKSRLHYLKELVKMQMYQKKLNIGNNEQIERNLVEGSLILISKLGPDVYNNKITKDSFSISFVHLVGLDRMFGIGRSLKGSQEQDMINLLIDASKVNMVIISYITDVSEFYPVKNYYRYFIMDKVERFSPKVDFNDYPPEVSKVCAVFYDKILQESRTFKRLSLNIID